MKINLNVKRPLKVEKPYNNRKPLQRCIMLSWYCNVCIHSICTEHNRILMFVSPGPFIVAFGTYSQWQVSLLLYFCHLIYVTWPGSVLFCCLHWLEAQWRQKTLLLRGLMSTIENVWLLRLCSDIRFASRAFSLLLPTILFLLLLLVLLKWLYIHTGYEALYPPSSNNK